MLAIALVSSAKPSFFYHHFLLFQSENHGASVERIIQALNHFFHGFTETQHA